MLIIKQIYHRKIIRGILLIGLFFSFLPSFIILSKAQRESAATFETLSNIYPHLDFSTYLGGNNYDIGNEIAVASDGSCYVIG